MQSFNYWEVEAIRKLGFERRMKSFSDNLETIKRVHGDEAYKRAILSEKPLSELGYAVRVIPPHPATSVPLKFPDLL